MELVTSLTNEYLSKIPNTSKITVFFLTEKENKKGTFKKVINLQAFSGGMERPFNSLSGGERASVNLAVDAAIGQIISERTGKTFGWMCLDEATDGMDATTKTESLQILKSLATDKLILVVEHTSEVNSNLDGFISISKKNEDSSFATTSN